MIICQLGIISNQNKEPFYSKMFEVQTQSEKKWIQNEWEWKVKNEKWKKIKSEK